jgi:hypothetical protein
VEGGARTRLTVAIVLVIVAVPIAVLVLGGGGDEPEEQAAGLRIERSPSAPELIVSVDPELNVPGSAGGARTVMLRCLDADGRLVHAHEEAWPLGGSDGFATGPHAHVPLDPAGMDEVASCRLVGTSPLLEGPVR